MFHGPIATSPFLPCSGSKRINTVPHHSTDPSSAEFMTFMRDYQDMVFTTAARLTGNDAQAEDIAQEVFIKAHAHFPEVKAGSPGGWLKTVTTNLAINHLTRYRRRWHMFSDIWPAGDVEWGVEDTLLADVGAEQRRRLIDNALKHLPAHQRIPLVLYHFDELSYQEIAARLRVSLSKVKTDILRGRAALLKILASSGLVREVL
jgi:RNA polymerase sigma-70 factor (ECF subfamily)